MRQIQGKNCTQPVEKRTPLKGEYHGSLRDKIIDPELTGSISHDFQALKMWRIVSYEECHL